MKSLSLAIATFLFLIEKYFLTMETIQKKNLLEVIEFGSSNILFCFYRKYLLTMETIRKTFS